jgi:mRNA-degrading endonuclease RelE of RelBE toxin-antitoxin system
MYQLITSPKAQKQLKRLKDIYQEEIQDILKEIEENPFISDLLIPLNRLFLFDNSCRII